MESKDIYWQFTLYTSSKFTKLIKKRNGFVYCLCVQVSWKTTDIYIYFFYMYYTQKTQNRYIGTDIKIMMLLNIFVLFCPS